MASCSSLTRSHFTFTWTTNNFFKETVDCLKSPVFLAESIDKTKWSLILYVPDWDRATPGHITCVLQRERDESGLDNIYIDFQISIVEDNGNILRSVKEDGYCFGSHSSYAGDTSYSVTRNLIQIKTFADNYDKYVPDNTLTLRCRMWNHIDNGLFGCIISRSEFCFARTILDVEKRSFVWTLDPTFLMTLDQERTIYVPCYSKGSSIQLSIILKQNYGEKVCRIEMYEVNNLKHVFFEILSLNTEGKIINDRCNSISNVTFVDKKCLLFHDFLIEGESKGERKRLPISSPLILQFNFQLSFGVAWSGIEDYRQESSEMAAVACVEIEEKDSVSSPCHSSCSSKKILEELLNNGTFSDVTIRAGTKSFPVHKSILGARSAVFKSMFLKDEVHHSNKVFDLPDIEEITLHNLLLYIYSGMIEDMKFEDALELYQSADKYQLMDLKDICKKSLMDNLSQSNIFQILSFANVYQDNKLKKAAQDFIFNQGNEFTSSEEWKNFKKRNLELAMETMECIYSRKRIKTEVSSTLGF